MKKFLPLLFIGVTFFLISCETTREVSLNQDNSGTLVTTTDMSGLIGMAKMSGQGKEMEKAGDQLVDTTLSLYKMADSISNITDEEKALVKKGKIGLQMNIPDEKFIIKLEFPFSNPEQISKLDKLSSRVIQQTLKKQLAGASADSTAGMPGADDIPETSFEDYFITTYSKNTIEKKLIKEKYANVENDKGMQSLKEMAGMGIGNSTLIINLPKPAKKADGKNVKLSDDKKKVTITSSAEDFFDDAAGLEFKIEY
jgi:hypothetical protein